MASLAKSLMNQDGMLLDRLQRANQGRRKDTLILKYKAMRKVLFDFSEPRLPCFIRILRAGYSRPITLPVSVRQPMVFLKNFWPRRTKKRKDLIAEFTRGSGLKRHLHNTGKRPVALEVKEREVVWNWLHTLLQEQGDYRLHDVALRIAGTSSIGLNRYAALVQSPNRKLHLLDIKATRSSVAEPFVGIIQPQWPDQASRIVTLQNHHQDVPPAKLWSLADPSEEYYVVRYLQPQADRMELTAIRIRGAQRLGQLLETMAQLTASAHLRSGGHQGSATAD